MALLKPNFRIHDFPRFSEGELLQNSDFFQKTFAKITRFTQIEGKMMILSFFQPL